MCLLCMSSMIPVEVGVPFSIALNVVQRDGFPCTHKSRQISGTLARKGSYSLLEPFLCFFINNTSLIIVGDSVFGKLRPTRTTRRILLAFPPADKFPHTFEFGQTSLDLLD